MPIAAIAPQPRRFNAKDSADLPIAQRAQQPFKTGAARSGSRDPEVVIDHLDVLPAQCACTIDKIILEPWALQIVLQLTRRRLTDVPSGPPGQMVSGDLFHRRP